MSDEQAKENLITAFIPLAEAIHALATSNQTAVLAEISALKDEIAKLTQRLTSLEQVPETLTPEEPTDPEEPIPEDPTPVDPEEPPVEDGPEPEIPPVEAPKDVLSTPYAITSGEWVNGVSTAVTRFVSADTEMLRKAFVVGSKVRFEDGDVRDITKSIIQYNKIYVELSGSKLNPATHGNGKMFIVNPTTEYVLPSEPETPVEPEPVVVAPLVGVNFAGLGNNPDVDSAYVAQMGTHYRSILDKPNVDYITRYTPTNGGKWVARIPYAAERLFSVANGSFTVKTAYLDQIKAVVSALNNAGATVLLDMHNYCRWWIKTPSTPISWAQRQQRVVNKVPSDAQWIPIGHALCPVDYAMLASMYEVIAKEFSGYDVMYGLMNEPHGRGAKDGGFDVQGQWVANVQQLIDAVRSVDTEHWITVGGNAYSSAKNWRAVSDGLRNVVGEKIMFEAHQYPDENGNGGGSWKKGIVHSIDPAARVADFYDYRDWLLEVGRPGMIGEFGTPVTYEKWTANSGGTFEYTYTVQGAAEYLQLMGDFSTENAILCCQWLAGPGDADNYANGMDTESTLKANALATVARMGTESAAGFGPFPVQ